MEFGSKEELFTFLGDLDGRINNLTEQLDKLNPVDETEETTEDTPEDTPDVTEEEINEIDKMLQGE